MALSRRRKVGTGRKGECGRTPRNGKKGDPKGRGLGIGRRRQR